MRFFPEFNFGEIKLIIQSGWRDLIGMDFSQIKFLDGELAIKIGLGLSILLALKFCWGLFSRWLGRENYSRKDSGYFISRKYQKPFWARLLLGLPMFLLTIPLTAILLALADPYFSITTEEKRHIETRTRIDLRDVSGSMAFPFRKGGSESNAEIAMNAHLKFLEMRRGKNDRTAFWLFSNEPFPVQEDLILDDELYYLKVFDAPWEIGSQDLNGTEDIWKTYRIPHSRYLYVSGQGGTQLSNTLKAIIEVFDRDAKKQMKTPNYRRDTSRAVLIITDAAISDFDKTEPEFDELSKRKIRPYIIFINGDNVEHLPEGEFLGISALLKEVVERGGKIFPVSSEDSLDAAYREIDRLERTRVEVEKKFFKISVFQKFVFIAILSLLVITMFGLCLRLFEYP